MGFLGYKEKWSCEFLKGQGNVTAGEEKNGCKYKNLK